MDDTEEADTDIDDMLLQVGWSALRSPDTEKLSSYKSPPVILLIGDSLTQFAFEPENNGWANQLSNAYSRKADIVNRGLSGYNSTWLRYLLPSIITSIQSDILYIILLVGSNDAALSPSVQHTSLPEYKLNIKEMIKYVISLGHKLIVATPPPLNERKWEIVCQGRGRQLDRTLRVTRTYRDTCINVCEAFDLLYLDTWKCFGVNDENEESIDDLFHDGLHFNTLSNTLFFKGIMDTVKQLGAHYQPDNLLLPLSLWGDVDVNNLPESLLNIK